MITQAEVEIYRDIYYEHFKPALNGRFAMPNEEAELLLMPVLTKYGWTMEKYLAFGQIDLMQRIARWNKPNVKMRYADGHEPDLSNISQMPELRCPRRTTER